MSRPPLRSFSVLLAPFLLSVGCAQLRAEAELAVAGGEAEELLLWSYASAGSTLPAVQDLAERALAALQGEMGGPGDVSGACESAVIEDSAVDDGVGVVRFDRSACDGAEGDVLVEVQSAEGPVDAQGLDAAGLRVVFDAASVGPATLDGVVDFAEGPHEGPISGQLEVNLGEAGAQWDFSGAIGAAPGVDVVDLDVAGWIVPDSGLRWRHRLGHVALSERCGEALGGEVLLWFDNLAGEHLARWTFDSVCDGCGALEIDGEPRGQRCW